MSEELTPHERRMQRRINFIESNPMAVSPQERSLLLGRRRQMEDEDRLRKHELGMLDKRNANALAIAKENRGAAREQGLDAANATANANIRLGEINQGIKEKEFELAQKRLEHEKEIEALKGKNNIDAISAQNKGSENVEKIRGESNVRVATEQAKGGIAREEIRRDIKREELKNKLDIADKNVQGKLGAEKIKNIRSILDEQQRQNPGMTLDQVFDKVREMYKTDPDVMLYLGGSASEGQPGDKYKRK
jgi:hypothetical protein